MNKVRKIELTDEEVHVLLTVLHLAGFKEKREEPRHLRDSRPEIPVVVGRIMKRLRKADHFLKD